MKSMDYLDQNIFLGKLSTCKKVTEKRALIPALSCFHQSESSKLKEKETKKEEGHIFK